MSDNVTAPATEAAQATTPAVEVKETQIAGNEQQSQETPQEPQPEKFSKQLKAIHRQQAEARKEREAVKQERQQWLEERKSREEKDKMVDRWMEALDNDDPLPFMRDKGYDVERLYKAFLKDEQDPKAVADRLQKENEKRWKKFEEEREQERQAQIDAQQNQQAAQNQQVVVNQIQEIIQSDPQRYELTALYPNAASDILHVVFEVYQAQGDKFNPTPEQAMQLYVQAADQVEHALEQQYTPVFKTSKAKKVLQDVPSDVVNDQQKPSSARNGRNKSTSRGNVKPRTLHAGMASQTTAGAVPGNETPEEKRRRLFEAWERGELRV